MGIALSQSRLMTIIQRKADLELRIMILTNRQQILASKAYQIQSDASMAQQFLAQFNTNAAAVNTWRASNPGVEPSDADFDTMPQYQALPAGYDTTEEIMSLENNSELDLMLINNQERAIEIESARLNTELAALRTEEASIKKLKDQNIKDTFSTFSNS